MTPGLHKNERGMVLLVVLLVVALLVTILVEFAFSTLVDLRLAETYRDTTRAHYLAKGGIQAGRAILQEDTNGYDGLDETWAQGIEGYPVADGTISIRIEDHSGRLDLNKLVEESGPSDVNTKRFKKLLELLGVDDTESLTDALVDWIDEDSGSEGAGAENFYYRSLPEPYNCKNGQLDSIQELVLVKGYDEKLLTLLEQHVTVYGSTKLNINTASAEVIQAWNYDTDVPDAGEIIVAARQKKPFTMPNQVNSLRPELQTFQTTSFAVSSNNYLIESAAFVNDGRRTIRAAVNGDGSQILYKRVL